VLSIFISTLGLFGLAKFKAEQRVKEIGVRKVLGASTTGIFFLLLKDFIHLILIAFILAVPFAWYGMLNWLQTFAYRIDLEWWYFVVAGLLAVSIGALTLTYQSLRAAHVDPVKNLRTE
jgi:putative ABC transport system permease protein